MLWLCSDYVGMRRTRNNHAHGFSAKGFRSTKDTASVNTGSEGKRVRAGLAGEVRSKGSTSKFHQSGFSINSASNTPKGGIA